MGASRTLLNKLDLDLIARMEANGRIERNPPAKRKIEPREGFTYRGARRNAARTDLSLMQRHAPKLKEHIAPAVYLNRSDKWPRARSYAYAREISPCPERPVR